MDGGYRRECELPGMHRRCGGESIVHRRRVVVVQGVEACLFANKCQVLSVEGGGECVLLLGVGRLAGGGGEWVVVVRHELLKYRLLRARSDPSIAFTSKERGRESHPPTPHTIHPTIKNKFSHPLSPPPTVGMISPTPSHSTTPLIQPLAHHTHTPLMRSSTCDDASNGPPLAKI